MRTTGRSLILAIILLLIFSTHAISMVPTQLVRACDDFIEKTIKNCQALSELCCDSRLKNVKAEGDQKKAMAEYYRTNKDSLMEEILVSDVDCHKEHEVKAFLIRKFFENTR